MSHEVVEAVEVKYVGLGKGSDVFEYRYRYRQSGRCQLMATFGCLFFLDDRIQVDHQSSSAVNGISVATFNYCRCISQERKNEDYEIPPTDRPSGIPAAVARAFVYGSTHFDADSVCVMFERIPGVQSDTNTINNAAIEWRD